MKIPERDFMGSFDAITDKLGGIFSKDEITDCLRDPKSLAVVQADIQNGMDIGVKATPSVFLNGRQITIPLTISTIQKLVDSK